MREHRQLVGRQQQLRMAGAVGAAAGLQHRLQHPPGLRERAKLAEHGGQLGLCGQHLEVAGSEGGARGVDRVDKQIAGAREVAGSGLGGGRVHRSG